jgi:YHS domain-containing protein
MSPRSEIDIRSIMKRKLLIRLPHYYVINSRGDKMAVDPVCKMEVNEKDAQWKTEYRGKTYYFCAPGCKKAFEENPHQYL